MFAVNDDDVWLQLAISLGKPPAFNIASVEDLKKFKDASTSYVLRNSLSVKWNRNLQTENRTRGPNAVLLCSKIMSTLISTIPFLKSSA